jgi:hypothetical protein
MSELRSRCLADDLRRLQTDPEFIDLGVTPHEDKQANAGIKRYWTMVCYPPEGYAFICQKSQQIFNPYLFHDDR